MKKALGQAPLTLGGWLFFLGWHLLGGMISSINNLNMKQLMIMGDFFVVLSVLPFVCSFVAGTFFLKRHKAFPISYIILETLYILSNIMTIILVVTIQSVHMSVFLILFTIIPIVIGILWIFYVLRSERVKKTFVYSWNEKPVQRLVDKANSMQMP